MQVLTSHPSFHKRSTVLSKVRQSANSQRHNNQKPSPHPSASGPRIPGPRSLASSQRQDFQGQGQTHAHQGRSSSTLGSSMTQLDHGTSYDATRNAQWNAATNRGSGSSDYGNYGADTTTCGEEMSLPYATSLGAGSLHYSHSDFPLCPTNPMDQACGSNQIFNNAGAYVARLHPPAMGTNQSFSPNQGSSIGNGRNELVADGFAAMDVGSYGLPSGPDFSSYDAYHALPSNWDIQGADLTEPQGMEWSSPLAITPSTSSLQSDYSLPDQQLDAPMSAGLFDGSWPSSAIDSLDQNLDWVPSFSDGEVAPQLLATSGVFDTQRLALSSQSLGICL